MRRHVLLLLCVLLLIGAPAEALEGRRFKTLTLAEGTAFETPIYVQDSGRHGPDVVIISGLHGDEPASAYAAGQIRHWPLRRGRLVVVPRGNVPALRAGKRLTPNVSSDIANANRNFPKSGEARDAPARGELGVALWALLRHEKPTWVLDLHEGFDIHLRNKESVGRSIIVAPDERTDAVVARMLGAVNASITNENERFVRLTTPVDGSLARAAAERLGARAMIVETATKGLARSTRAMQQRRMVHAFLSELDMLTAGVEAADVGYIDGVEQETIIGIYDGGGTGGSGVPNLLRQLPALDGVAVSRIGPTEIRYGALDGFDVVVFPGGMGGTQSKMLGAAGREHVRKFVDRGGGYVGICAGAYLACRGFSWGLGILDARTKSPKWKRGKGIVRVELTDDGRTLLPAAEVPFGVLYANGPILEPADDPNIPDYETLAHFRTEVARNGTPKGIMIDSSAIVRGTFGKGRVVAFSPHPEQTKGLDDMVRRAVAWSAQDD